MSSLASFYLTERNRRGGAIINTTFDLYDQENEHSQEIVLTISYKHHFRAVTVFFKTGVVRLTVPSAFVGSRNVVALINRFFHQAELPYALMTFGRGVRRRTVIRNRITNSSMEFTGRWQVGLSGRQYRKILEKSCGDSADVVNLLDLW